LGDDSEWRALLQQADGTMSEANLQRLEAYKAHFGKFFIADNAWTRANFDNMQKNKLALSAWVSRVGKDTFRTSNIPLLSDVHKQLKEQGVDLENYNNMANAIFNTIFNQRIKPILQQEQVTFDEDNTLQSRAFRRYLIGQTSLFSRFPTPLHLEDIKEDIFKRLQNDAPFSIEEQDEIRLLMEQYIVGLEGLRLMSYEESLNAIDCSSVFPAVYISYPEMQKKYHSIENCVKECIESYKDSTPATPVPKVSHNRTMLFAKKAPDIEVTGGMEPHAVHVFDV
jgi:hypothetical protein